MLVRLIPQLSKSYISIRVYTRDNLEIIVYKYAISLKYHIISPVDIEAEYIFSPKMLEKSLPGLKFELVQSRL